MSEESDEIAAVRAELAKERAEVERLKLIPAREKPWIDRHFMTLATVMVSLATLLFSYVQWHVAQVNALAAKAESLRLEEQEKRRRDEEWSLKAVEFVFAHEKHFFESTPQNFQIAVRMLAVGFPERVSEPLLKRLELTATPEERLEVNRVRAQIKGETPPPRQEPVTTAKPPVATSPPHPRVDRVRETPPRLEEPRRPEVARPPVERPVVRPEGRRDRRR